MAELLGLSGEGLPRKCHTLGGFVLHHLGHLPRMGEQFEHEGQVFEVVDMDGRRIDRVMVRQSSP